MSEKVNKIKSFTVQEICNIMARAYENKVACFRYNGLEISFNKELPKPNPNVLPPNYKIELDTKVDGTLEDLHLENLMINDPLQYEKVMGEVNE